MFQREKSAGFDLTQAFLSTTANVLVNIMKTTLKRCGTHAALTIKVFYHYVTKLIMCFVLFPLQYVFSWL